MKLYNVYFDDDGQSYEYVVNATSGAEARWKVVTYRERLGVHHYPECKMCADVVDFSEEGVSSI